MKIVSNSAIAGIFSWVLVGACYAEEFPLPPQECIDVARNQLYSANPPWFSYRAQVPAAADAGLHIAASRQFSDLLEEYGQELVIVPPFSPAAFAPMNAGGGRPFDSEVLWKDSIDLIDAHIDAGVNMVDLTPATLGFTGDLAYQRRTDHHWTAEGAARSAQYVSSQIFGTEFPSMFDWISEFENFPTEVNTYLPPIARSLLCDADEFAIEDKFVEFPAQAASSELDAQLLFGSSENKVAVLGSSHTAKDSGNVFPQAIEYYSGTPIVEHSYGGGGAATSVMMFLAEETHLDAAVDKVIWVPTHAHLISQMSGGALLGAGMITGSCAPDDIFFAEYDIQTEYGEWVELPNMVGLRDRIDVFVDKNEKLEFEITLVGQDPVKSEIFFGSGKNVDEPYVWNVHLPRTALSEIGLPPISKVRLRVTGFRDYTPSGSLNFRIATCGNL